MLYIYDILLNFIDGDRMYEFFEWKRDDNLEHIKKIPLIKVDSDVLYDLIYNNVRVDSEFLSLIKDKCLTYKEKLDYASIITDGYKCYALEFNKEGEVIFKSGLLLDEEDEVLECSGKLVNVKLGYILTNKNKNTYLLTRSEELKYNVIKKDLESSYKNKNYAKIDYLYTEVIDNKNIDVKDKYEKLIREIDSKNTYILKKIYYIINMSKNSRKAL